MVVDGGIDAFGEESRNHGAFFSNGVVVPEHAEEVA
jgi:hypothetical protein